jgi:hypothetical protein
MRGNPLNVISDLGYHFRRCVFACDFPFAVALVGYDFAFETVFSSVSELDYVFYPEAGLIFLIQFLDHRDFLFLALAHQE